MLRFCAFLLIALLALLLVACSSDRPPANVEEAELSVGRTMGQFNPNYGWSSETILFVKIKGKEYRLEAREGSEVIGFEEIQSLVELAGRRVLVAGEIDEGTYYASYTKLLPGEGSDEFTVVVPKN